MKKEELPQDKSALAGFTKELTYAVDASGNYTTGLSEGWEVKAAALDLAWQDIEERVLQAREQVVKGQVSPIVFYMELKVMDLETLAAYMGYWKWRVKRHFKPSVFNTLSEKQLQKYAEVFEVNVSQLKNIHEYDFKF
jgi:hypothetical protein